MDNSAWPVFRGASDIVRCKLLVPASSLEPNVSAIPALDDLPRGSTWTLNAFALRSMPIGGSNAFIDSLNGRLSGMRFRWIYSTLKPISRRFAILPMNRYSTIGLCGSH